MFKSGFFLLMLFAILINPLVQANLGQVRAKRQDKGSAYAGVAQQVVEIISALTNVEKVVVENLSSDQIYLKCASADDTIEGSQNGLSSDSNGWWTLEVGQVNFFSKFQGEWQKLWEKFWDPYFATSFLEMKYRSTSKNKVIAQISSNNFVFVNNSISRSYQKLRSK